MMISTPANGFIYQSEHYAFDNTGESLKKYTLLKENELSYNHGASKLRPYGSCFVMKNTAALVPFVYHSFSVPSADPDFISLELNLDSMQRNLRKLISSGARMDGLLNISYAEYTSLPLTLPKHREQKRISTLILSVDSLITLHQREGLKPCQRSHYKVDILVFQFLDNVQIYFLCRGHARMAKPTSHACN